MKNKKFIAGFLICLFLSLVVYRTNKLHNYYTIQYNNYTRIVKHPDGLQVSDYKTLENGNTLIYYELPEK